MTILLICFLSYIKKCQTGTYILVECISEWTYIKCISYLFTLLLTPFSSVAIFLLWGGGGGGARPPNVPTKKDIMYNAPGWHSGRPLTRGAAERFAFGLSWPWEAMNWLK